MSDIIWTERQEGVAGNIKYGLLTEEYFEEALNLLETTFFTKETTSTACGLPDDEESRKDMKKLCVEIAKYGISLIAIDIEENRIAGVAINQLHVKGNEFYDEFKKSCKSNVSRNYLECMEAVDILINFFERYNCTSYIELLFLATHPGYQKQNIATKLTEFSVSVAKQLKKERIAKQQSNSEELTDPAPFALVAVFTSKISQKIGLKCSFETILELPYEEIEVNGKSLYDMLGKKGEIIVSLKEI